MDAFFTSVEQRDNPELRGKAIAVGGGKRGVIAAASYEARKYGVYSAMPSAIAKRKCPHLIFVKHNFEAYRKASKQIREIFYNYSNFVQPLSLDEAYLDITENIAKHKSARETAQAIKNDIFEKTQLTASAGVSFNKFLAKIASDLDKPNGIAVITPEKAPAFIDKLPIGKFYGIGKVTEQKMKNKGIFCGADLKKFNKFELAKMFGKSGKHFFDMVNLLDNRSVIQKCKNKSMSSESTFYEDIESFGIIALKLNTIAKKLINSLHKGDDKIKTISIKIRYKDFVSKTRSKTLKHYTWSEKEILFVCKELLKQEELLKPVRLLGVNFSNFLSENKKNNGQTYFDF